MRSASATHVPRPGARLAVLVVAFVASITACTAASSGSDPSAAPGTASVTDDTAREPAPAPATAPPVPCPTPAVAVAAGDPHRTIVVGGVERSYELIVPPGIGVTEPAPLVVTFHGLGSTSARQVLYSRFGALAEQEGFVVVAPQALGSPPRWDFLTPATTPTSDAAFIDAMLDEVEASTCIDPDRVFASGISLGSALVFAAACSGSDRFAAYGGVAATFYAPPCDDARPAPIRYFHGTDDRIVPFDGGKSVLTSVQPARAEIAEWAAHNGCPDEPTETAVSSTLTRVSWTGCRDDADVVFDIIAGGGHTWPGSDGIELPAAFGATTTEVDATQEMWDFFVAHARTG